MALVCDTLSCPDGQMCQIIFKSHNAGRTYGPDTILVNREREREGERERERERERAG